MIVPAKVGEDEEVQDAEKSISTSRDMGVGSGEEESKRRLKDWENRELRSWKRVEGAGNVINSSGRVGEEEAQGMLIQKGQSLS